MAKPTDVRIVDVQSGTQRFAYRTPMKFGGRVVTDALLFDVNVTVETVSGRRATGHGSMPLGNTWAWPSDRLTPEVTLAALRKLAELLSGAAAQYKGCGHPLEITRELAADLDSWADTAGERLALDESMPPLAMRVAASPLEAAIHDAYGKALGRNSYDLLGPEFVPADLAHYLSSDFAGEYLDSYTLRAPKPRMPLYHLVGALDPLSDADVLERLGDGLPETLRAWIDAEGLTHLKIKLNGDDLAWDVDRVVSVDRIADEARGDGQGAPWNFSLDFNEKCRDVQYVLDFLARLKERSPRALDRVQYIEQPTHRDLRANPENRMHAAAAIKPVVIDESLIDLDSLLLARRQGYSGVALKACKGHSEALLMGAAAQHYEMFLCVQDLTCPGASFLHSATLCARIPTVAGIEGNARQYCPAANESWRDRFPGMFNITDGSVQTGTLAGAGLGF